MENVAPFSLPPPLPSATLDSSAYTPLPRGADEPEERFLCGIAAGAVAAFLAAAVWGTLVALTHFKIGYAAIGIGYLVGIVVRGVGHGQSARFGYVGAALALLGCVAGDVFSTCAIAAEQIGRSLPLIFLGLALKPWLIGKLLAAAFTPLSAIFYFLATMAGYRNSFHH